MAGSSGKGSLARPAVLVFILSLSFIPSSEANGWCFRKGSLVPLAVLLYSLSPNLFAAQRAVASKNLRKR